MIELDSFDEDCFERLAKDYVDPAGGNHQIDALSDGRQPSIRGDGAEREVARRHRSAPQRGELRM